MQLGPDFFADILATYSNLLQNIIEFVVIAVLLYAVGRVVVETVGPLFLQRSKFDETMADGVRAFSGSRSCCSPSSSARARPTSGGRSPGRR